MKSLCLAVIFLSVSVWCVLVFISRHRTLYRTTDGRCWSAFVPNNAEVEQPANGSQQAVKPLYAITVPCR